MSLITKTLQPKSLLHLSRVANVATTKQCHWFPDYKPGPYPKTQKEREEAAKKYNLLPEEYEPYPDNGIGCGDYPKLPFESVDSKDHNVIYDFPTLRRDYMEPVPREQIILLPEMLSTGPRKYTYGQECIYFFKFFAVAVAVCWYLSRFQINKPIMERQVPTRGVTHYTFELDHEGLAVRLKRLKEEHDKRELEKREKEMRERIEKEREEQEAAAGKIRGSGEKEICAERAP